MIELRNITFTYPGADRPALSRLSISIDKGERVCVMGGNGSGKSTLALLMAGLLNGADGAVERKAKRLDSDRIAKTAILFQNPDSRMVATTVEREIAFSLECQGRSFEEMNPIVESTAKTFGVDHLKSRQTYTLSGGEKQRVALASMFVIEPDLLILDEPDSFLDIAGRRILERELARLRRTEKDLTEIRITQYLSVGKQYDRLVVLHDGGILADAPPARIMADRALMKSAGLDRASSTGSKLSIARLNLRSPARQIRRIEIENLKFGYGAVPLLEDISADLERGTTTAIIGRSGSGKSTLAGLVGGLHKPQSGTIRYLDDQKQTLSPDEMRGQLVQLVQFPERQFYLPTCREEIIAGPANLKQRFTPSDVEHALGTVGLPPELFLDRDPLTLSMGEKRRLALGCLLVMNPVFLILDEPTCGLDPSAVGWFEEMMASLKKQGMGQLLISHDATLVQNLADKVIRLNEDHSASVMETGSFFSGSGWADLLSEA